MTRAQHTLHDDDPLITLTERVSAHNYAPLPIVVEHAEGAWVHATDGRRYLDCISAYSSLNQGHRHPRIVAALIEQAGRVTLTSRAVHNDRLGPFLAELCKLTGYDRALPMNTGAEAVETAIKIARRWGYRRRGIAADRARIVVCDNNFHGRTTTLVGFSSDPQYRADFGPFDGAFDRIPFGDAAALDAAIGPDTAAFLVEPIQAEAGVLLPPPGFLAAARALCRERGVLFMLDEIQTGLGRTGRLLAHEHEADARPDLLILGKALGGGVYPVSAVLAADDIMELLAPGDHGSTFGGNPLAAAVGSAALAVIVDERLAERAATLGRVFRERLAAIDSARLVSVRGQGLLIGLEIDRAAGPANAFARQLLNRGLLTKDTHEQVLRLSPPLIVTEHELDWAVEQIAAVLR